jgi:hypothetical protein
VPPDTVIGKRHEQGGEQADKHGQRNALENAAIEIAPQILQAQLSIDPIVVFIDLEDEMRPGSTCHVASFQLRNLSCVLIQMAPKFVRPMA